jgi:hypothetical protein
MRNDRCFVPDCASARQNGDKDPINGNKMRYGVQNRSLEKLDQGDLRRLSKLTLNDLQSLYQRRPETGALYADRLIALCLCQGAAEHFVRPGHGIKDFDVRAFFSAHPERPFPYRRQGIVDFGMSRFGRHPDDSGFAGRRVDVIG